MVFTKLKLRSSIAYLNLSVATLLFLIIMLIANLCFAATYEAIKDKSDIISIKVPLYIGKVHNQIAKIYILKDTNQLYIPSKDLLDETVNLLNPAKYMQLKQIIGNMPLVEPNDIPQDLLIVNFDRQQLALHVEVPPTNQPLQQITARFLPDKLANNIVPTSNVSAYINFRGSQDYIENSNEFQNEGRQPFRLGTEGAVNIKNYVVEADTDYLEDAEHAWQINRVRMIHDLPDHLMRVSAGDLSYPVSGFQNFQSMLGFSASRNFDLNPYKVSEPTGSTSFTLINPARVDIFVNGQKIRTVQLEPGQYDINDFPVVNGTNNIELIITDSLGQIERKTFPVISDDTLLDKGLNEFTYNFGLPSTIENRETSYAENLLSTKVDSIDWTTF